MFENRKKKHLFRMKRQQSMFTDDHEDNQPSVSFKKPRLNLLSKMGKSFETDVYNKVRHGTLN